MYEEKGSSQTGTTIPNQTFREIVEYPKHIKDISKIMN